MNETRYRGARQMRTAGWALLGMAPVIMLVAAAVLALKGGFTLGHFELALFFAVLSTPIFLYIAARYLGSTIVSREGIRTRGFLRRSLRWSEITALAVEAIPARGSGGYALYAHREKGVPVLLPGLLAMKEDDADLVAKAAEIRSVWSRETARE